PRGEDGPARLVPTSSMGPAGRRASLAPSPPPSCPAVRAGSCGRRDIFREVRVEGSRPLSEEQIISIEEHLDRAFGTLEDFFATVEGDPEFAGRVRERAAAARDALDEARDAWPHLAEDLRAMRDRFTELRVELGRVERAVGDL